jgi:TPR repeat protein
MSPADRSAMIRTMVDRLAERLKGAPDDLAGWRRLARSYGVLGEADKARAARAHVARLERKSAGGSSAMGKPAARTPSAPGRRESFAVATKAFDGGDYATAFETWRRLAAAGDAEAQTAIAGMYRRGEGRKVNLTAAAAWYRRAAQQGEAVAQMNLGEMYRLGQGVARDKAQAYVWFTLAATGGKTWAAAELQKLTGTMTVDEITRAAGLLRDQSLQIPAK